MSMAKLLAANMRIAALRVHLKSAEEATQAALERANEAEAARESEAGAAAEMVGDQGSS